MQRSRSKNRIFLNGTGIFPFTSQKELLEYIEDKQKILIAINTEKILSEDSAIKQIINENIGYPDGIGATIALRRKGVHAIKIPGARLWLDIIRKFHHDKSFYLIGSTIEVIGKTYKNLKDLFPGLRILNYRDGYFAPEEVSDIINDIKEKRPDVVFVAIGSPKQEYIMAKFFKEYPALYMGLGGSFDLYCGHAHPVPDWWNRIFKWEGLYRALNDFRNIKRWKRQLPALRILYKVLLNKL